MLQIGGFGLINPQADNQHGRQSGIPSEAGSNWLAVSNPSDCGEELRHLLGADRHGLESGSKGIGELPGCEVDGLAGREFQEINPAFFYDNRILGSLDYLHAPDSTADTTDRALGLYLVLRYTVSGCDGPQFTGNQAEGVHVGTVAALQGFDDKLSLRR